MKTKAEKRLEADERKQARSSMSAEQQIAALKARPGKSTKEIKRLMESSK